MADINSANGEHPESGDEDMSEPFTEDEDFPDDDIDMCYEDDDDLCLTRPPPPKFEALKSIERKTYKAIFLKTTEDDVTLSQCHSQEQSPLFTTLPREIRDLIWRFATAPYEDEERAYENTKYYYRPGHTGPLKTDYSILLTCRRAWLEANAYPMLQSESYYWRCHDRARIPPHARSHQWMDSLTASNRRNLGHLRILAQSCNIEALANHRVLPLQKWFSELRVQVGHFQPRILTATLRHTDWWYWENETPLRLEDRWVQTLLDTEELRSTHFLKLELETLDYKVDQLMPIVDRLSKLESAELKTHMLDGKPTSTKFILHREPEVQKWSGPAKINGQEFTPYQGKDTLNYHIVTLTWRLHFPQIPHAHAPTLRRAPRVGVHDDVDGTLYPAIPYANEAPTYWDDDFPCMPVPRGLSPWQRFRNLRNRHLVARQVRLDMDDEHEISPMASAVDSARAKERYDADVHEWYRRVTFNAQMAIIHEERWLQEWQAKGSLLKFED